MTLHADTESWLASLPKADLHVHLDGSVKPQTILELAKDRRIELPANDAEGLLPYMRVKENCDSLRDYLRTFDFALRFMQDGEALERIAYELVEQAALERCIYIEVRYAPQLHTRGGLTLKDTIAHVIRGLQRGEAAFGVTARVIVICMRHQDMSVNRPVVEAAERFLGRGVVAIDLAGDEASYPANRFRDLFTLANERGLKVTIHAGEAAGPENVCEAIEHLGARRIGHGVRLTENRAALEMVKARRIPLEMCPVSNIQTKAVRNWEEYPIRMFMDEGLPVTVNTDNRTVSGTTLTREYRTLMERCGVAKQEVASLVRNALDAAFIEEEDKRRLHRTFDEALLESERRP